MRRSIAFGIVVCLLAAGIAALPAWGVSRTDEKTESPVMCQLNRFSGGDGSLGNPYQVSNVTELQWMGNATNFNKHFVLKNDIDASATKNWNSGKGFKPIGSFASPFNGSLDGKRHSILKLYIKDTSLSYVGLLGYLGNGSMISNLSIVDQSISGNLFTGGLIGELYQGTVYNCSTNGNVTSTFIAGGLVGCSNFGSIHNCTSSGNISGSGSGGLVGSNGGSIKNCTSRANVKTGVELGGLIGRNWGILKDCVAWGNVTGDYSVGGLVGTNDYRIEGCMAFGNITGTHHAGGLIGGASNLDYIINSFYCINRTTINGKNRITYYGLYQNQFDDWIKNKRSLDIGKYMKKISGSEYYEIKSLSDIRVIFPFALGRYQFRQTSDLDFSSDPELYIPVFNGKTFDGGNKSISHVNITNVITIYLGFFGYVNNNSTVLNMNVCGCRFSGYTRIGGMAGYSKGNLMNCTVSGNITGNDNYAGGLIGYNYHGKISNCSSNANVSGNGYVGGLIGYSNGPLKYCHSSGHVVGKADYIGGFVAYNEGENITYSSAATYLRQSGSTTIRYIGGLVGYNSGKVRNCSSECNFTGFTNARYVGGLIGSNYWDNVTDCYSCATPTADLYVGGLIGRNTGTITRCFALGDVAGTSGVGGFIGQNYGQISNCYAIGNITGSTNAGGFVGRNDKTIKYCYCDGYVPPNMFNGPFVGYNFAGSETACFWNKETAGTSGGKTTAELKTKSTFTGAGWDFTNIWSIYEGVTYPLLNSIDYCQILTGDLNTSIVDVLYKVEYLAGPPLPGKKDITWNLTTNTGPWLSMHQNGTLTGTPDYSDIGSYWVNVTTSCQGKCIDFTNFTLKVKSLNVWPAITSLPITTANEDTVYWTVFTAFDPDAGDLLSWTYDTNASWLIFDNIARNLSGIPTNSEVGCWWINVSVSDVEGGSDFVNYTLTVENVNDPPVITTVTQNVSVYEDQELFIRYMAYDIDPTNDVLFWSLDANASFLTINTATGNLSGVPTNAEIGKYWVNVTVSDGKGGIACSNFTLTVTNVNDRPQIKQHPADRFFDEDTVDTQIRLNEWFFDADKGDILSFRYEMNSNITVTILPNGTVVLQPKTNWSGTESLTFFANDKISEVSDIVNVTVRPMNDAPFDASITTDSLTIHYDDPLVFIGNASDVDIPYGDVLTYSWYVENWPVPISQEQICNASMTFKVGMNNYTLVVSDSENMNCSAKVQVLVVDVSGQPDDDVTDDDVTNVTDTDHDGLPDSWEMNYFHNLTYGPNDDPDKDDLTNLQEYQQGKDPTKADTVINDDDTDDDTDDDVSDDDTSSNLGLVIGIIIGAVILVLIIGMVVAFLLLRKKKAEAPQSEQTMQQEPGSTLPDQQVPPIPEINVPEGVPQIQQTQATMPPQEPSINIEPVFAQASAQETPIQTTQPVNMERPQTALLPQQPVPVTAPVILSPVISANATFTQLGICSKCGQPGELFPDKNRYWCFGCNKWTD